MPGFQKELINDIVKSCLDQFNRLPKNGKPVDNEWTILSCVVQYDSETGKFEVVSLGTGSKCVGATKMSSAGDVLNDSHAEVFARRGFLLYLYDAIRNNSPIFSKDTTKYKLKENIEFMFYSSQLPCGDASIIPMSKEEEHFGDVINLKRKTDTDQSNIDRKRQKLEVDVHRTGAKCLPGATQDPKGEGTEYHVVAQVRIKPGRGDRTLSVSCSDKMARWIHVGIQGGLLDLLLIKPINITYFIFGSGVLYSIETLTRALLKRKSDGILLENVPQIYQSDLRFEFARVDRHSKPAPGSIVWSKFLERPEVAVQGRKLGVTKKNSVSPTNSLCISKYKLYYNFLCILKENTDLQKCILGTDSVDNIPYNVMKRKSKLYLERWEIVKESFFQTWTKKPDLWNFVVNV